MTLLYWPENNGPECELSLPSSNCQWTNANAGHVDAYGRMVEISSGTTYKEFVYRPSGTLLAVYGTGLGPIKGTIPLPGGSTAIDNAGGLNYIRHRDWLGSSRLATTWTHANHPKETYAPFGETYDESGTPDRSFTGLPGGALTFDS
jgi:hypothetical protein